MRVKKQQKHVVEDKLIYIVLGVGAINREE